jgi:pimeloyl-ACP methyl ester carboxylesterase
MPTLLRRAVLPLLCCVAGVAAVAAVQLVAANRQSDTLAHSAETAVSYPEWLRPCTAPGVNGPALCGTHEVWENRMSRSGRRVGLHVLVLPARGPERKPDPVFYLAGGPGGGASTGVQLVANVLARAHQQRDLVFVDARGTGRSTTSRKCGTPSTTSASISSASPEAPAPRKSI